MRIVAGEFRSRIIKAVPGDGTRPTTDKIKEAIFSRIGPYFNGGTMLDLFGGSGNIGLEAISRGIEKVYFADRHVLAIKTIKENAMSLQVEKQCIIWKMDYKRALQQAYEHNLSFDIIFLDPPYMKQQIASILTFIDDHQLLNKSGQIICESLKEDIFEDTYRHFEKVKDSTYGITRITYFEGKKK